VFLVNSAAVKFFVYKKNTFTLAGIFYDAIPLLKTNNETNAVIAGLTRNLFL